MSDEKRAEPETTEGARRPRRPPGGGPSWIRLSALSILSILVAFGAYYFVYMAQHEERLVEYHLRQLAVAGHNVAQTIDGLRLNVDNAISAAVEGGDESVIESLVQNVELIPALEKIEAERGVEVPGALAGWGLPRETKTGGAKFRAEAGWREGRTLLRFLSVWHSGTRLPLSSWLSVEAGLEKVIGPALPTEDFDSVVLARQSGEVLVTVGRHHLRLMSLPPPAAAEAEQNGSGGERSLEEGAEDLGSLTRIYDLSIAGDRFKVFLQPIAVPSDVRWVGQLYAPSQQCADAPERLCLVTGPAGAEGTPAERLWLLAGLKRASSFGREVRSIPTPIVLATVGLVVWALLALPYLKIRFTGVREALRKQDVLTEAVAIVLAAALVTIAVSEILVTRELGRDQDRKLRELARQLETEFFGEIDRLDSLLGGLSQQARISDGTRSHDGRWADLLTEEQGLLNQYPFLEMVYWMNEGGQQLEKWSVKGRTTPLIGVGDRVYFKRAKMGEMLQHGRHKRHVGPRPLQPEESVCEAGYFLESIRSKTTGEVFAVLSRRCPFPLKTGRGEVEAVVGAVLSPLLSVINPVLSPAHGFAIINVEGQVLFHSDKRRNLQEDFFEELAGQDGLRAAVESGARAEMEVQYRDRFWRLHSRPLVGTPWSLLVFADEEPMRMVRVEALSLTFLLFGCYVLAALFITLGLLYADPGQKPSAFFLWFWPDPPRIELYFRQFLGYLVLTLAWLIAMVFWSPRHGAVACGLLGILGIAFCIVVLRETKHGPVPLQASRLLWHLLALLPFLLLSYWWGWRVWPLLLLTALSAALVQRRVESSFLILVTLALFEAARSAWEGAFGTALAATLATAGLLHLTYQFDWPPFGREKDWKFWYCVGAVALALVAGVLPSLAFFRAAHDDSMALFCRYQQLGLVRKLAERDQRLADRFRDIKLSDSYLRLIERELYPKVMGEAPDIYLPHDQNAEFIRDQQPPESPSEPPSLLGELSEVLPQMTPLSSGLRYLSVSEGLGAQWAWDPNTEPSVISLSVSRNKNLLDLGKRTRPTVAVQSPGLLLSSQTPRLRIRDFLSLAWLLSALGGVGLLWIVVRSVTKRVFLIDEPHPRHLSGTGLGPSLRWSHRLELRSWQEADKGAAEGEACSIDSSRLWGDDRSPKQLAAQAAQSGKDTVVVQRLHDGLWEPRVAARKLELLESLLDHGVKQIIVHSEVNPLHYFKMVAADYSRGAVAYRPDLERWSAVLERFTRIRQPLQSGEMQWEAEKVFHARLVQLRRDRVGEAPQTPDSKNSIDRNLELLAQECFSLPRLREIAERLACHPQLAALQTEEQVIAAVLDMAESYYRVLWSISSKDERMVLYRLCQHGFVSWTSRELLRRLIHRGMIRATPNFRPLNQSFRDFVTHAELPEVFRAWEREAGVSVWARIRIPLVLAAVVLMGFLFATQPDVFERTLAIVAALLASIPLLLRLLTMFTAVRPLKSLPASEQSGG